jgi:NAD(P)-dependent dehydrogenase (short-subunit alcohol dehydrogenase family)
MSFLDNLYNLTGKVVVVTGATGQLGRKITNAFVQTGCTTIGLDVKINDANKVDGADYYEIDIVSQQSVIDGFDKIITAYGSLDILVNNAGVSTFAPFEEREEKDLDWVMDVNVKGTFFCIQSFVNLFDKHKFKRGAIVNIGSFYGVVSPDFRLYTDTPRKNSEIYGASKAGVIQMTKYFGVHLADRNIRVNAVSPGGIFNPANPQGPEFLKHYSFRCPMKRMANDDEMIGAVLYLAGDAATYTTGQNIVVDGGMTCW